MSETPKVSVNMPVYNGEKYIDEAIQSILNQTFKDFELIIIDNASTDQTVKKIQAYQDPRIRLIQNPKNMGLVFSRNKALSESKGDYIAVLDADDIAYPTRLAEQTRFMDEHSDFALIGTWTEVFNSYGQILSYWKPEFSPKELLVHSLFINPLAHSSAMIRKTALPDQRYQKDYAPAEDYDLWVRIASKHKVGNIPKVLVQYRAHQNSTGSQQKDTQIQNARKIYLYQLENLGLIPDEDELNLHCIIGKLYHNNMPRHILNKTEAWLMKLWQANKKTRSYDEVIFEKVLGEVWQSSFDLMPITDLLFNKPFWTSPLNDLAKLPFSRRVALLIKLIPKKIALSVFVLFIRITPASIKTRIKRIVLSKRSKISVGMII
ncbi:MAG: glycosyl transferase [bacterium]|nr:MAG: glycosyl transferase [bacterium]